MPEIRQLIHSLKEKLFIQEVRVRERHWKRLAACWFTPIPGNNSQLRAGTKNSILESHIGGRGLSAWAIICCLPRNIGKNAGLEAEQQDFELVL